MKINIIKYSKLWLAISGLMLVAAFVAIGVYGLKFGIDFTGGTLIELKLDDTMTADQVRGVYGNLGYEVNPQQTEDGSWIARLGEITPDQRNQIKTSFAEKSSTVEELRFESIGPVVGKELKRKSVTAVILTLVFITIYVAWAFRKVSKPVASWKYGLITIIAAAHDVILPIGVFAVLGHFYGYQIDTAFIAAILTILGYSINDTIVVFDRTRENLVTKRHSDASFGEIVNSSIMQTFARSINTTLTTLLALIAIFIFGAESVKPFALALFIGIFFGAYSSIFIASPLLVFWQKRIK